MAEVTVRSATADDSKAIAACWHRNYFDQGGVDELPAALLKRRTLDAFEARAASRAATGDTVVAVEGGRVVGFAVAKRDANEVEQVFVDGAARGTGVAARLLSAAEARLAGGRMHLVATPKNARAIRFYEKAGWTRVGPVVYDAEVGDGTTCAVDLARFEKARECD